MTKWVLGSFQEEINPYPQIKAKSWKDASTASKNHSLETGPCITMP